MVGTTLYIIPHHVHRRKGVTASDSFVSCSRSRRTYTSVISYFRLARWEIVLRVPTPITAYTLMNGLDVSHESDSGDGKVRVSDSNDVFCIQRNLETRIQPAVS